MPWITLLTNYNNHVIISQMETCKIVVPVMAQDNVLAFTLAAMVLFVIATFAIAVKFVAALREHQGVTFMVVKTALMIMAMRAEDKKSETPSEHT
jgi:hypothetical protein